MNHTQTTIALNDAFFAMYEEMKKEMNAINDAIIDSGFADKPVDSEMIARGIELANTMAHFWNVAPQTNAEDVE